MPHRKLVQIGKPASLPTVAQYFRDLALRQGEDIRILKERAAEQAERRAEHARRKSIPEESWRLHPVIAAQSPTPEEASTKNRRSMKRSVIKKSSSKRRTP